MSGITEGYAVFCGQAVSTEQLELIGQLTARYRNLSRTELSATVCELLGWVRPNGKPKTVECRQFLQQLEQQQRLRLPAPRAGRPKGSSTRITSEDHEAVRAPIESALEQLQPIGLERVSSGEARGQWRSLVEQYHYLGHRVPFGAHLRYLIQSERGVLGCLQFSSPAWRLQARDRWIGWGEEQRKRRLQHIVCNSRFLILPWVRVRHLASHVLAKAVQRLVTDWQGTYEVTPWLLETLVDPAHYRGTCYRAANWIEVGMTSGRGRDDRHHRRHGAAPKALWLYPLCPDARERLSRGA